MYEDILSLSYDDVRGRKDIYADDSRKVATMASSDFESYSEEGTIIAYFNVITGKLMVISERFDNDSTTRFAETLNAVNQFNINNKDFIAVADLSEDTKYIDVITTSRHLSEELGKAL